MFQIFELFKPAVVGLVDYVNAPWAFLFFPNPCDPLARYEFISVYDLVRGLFYYQFASFLYLFIFQYIFWSFGCHHEGICLRYPFLRLRLLWFRELCANIYFQSLIVAPFNTFFFTHSGPLAGNVFAALTAYVILHYVWCSYYEGLVCEFIRLFFLIVYLS